MRRDFFPRCRAARNGLPARGAAAAVHKLVEMAVVGDLDYVIVRSPAETATPCEAKPQLHVGAIPGRVTCSPEAARRVEQGAEGDRILVQGISRGVR